MATWPDGLGPILEGVVSECISGKREYSDEHDFTHSREDWLDLIQEHVVHARDADFADDTERYRHELNVVAALVLSAQRADRKKHGNGVGQPKHGVSRTETGTWEAWANGHLVASGPDKAIIQAAFDHHESDVVT